MKTGRILIATLLTLGLGLAACEKKEEGALEKATENVQDGLGTRKHEELKDAGENVGDAARDAKEGVKEETRDATD